MRYAFVAEIAGGLRLGDVPVSAHPAERLYAWVNSSLSKRAQEDARQTELLKEAWVESGKVYGHRKLHDDLLEQGESVCLNRVARLTKLAGIIAQIGYKRRPGKYGGKPSVVVDNTLDRQFDVEALHTVWVTTFPTSGRRRASPTWRWSSICSHAAWSDGPCSHARRPTSCFRLC